jgi:hypothetical protein
VVSGSVEVVKTARVGWIEVDGQRLNDGTGITRDGSLCQPAALVQGQHRLSAMITLSKACPGVPTTTTTCKGRKPYIRP